MADNDARAILSARIADLRVMLDNNLEEYEGITFRSAAWEVIDIVEQFMSEGLL